MTENKFVADNQEMMREWNWEENNKKKLDPNILSQWSDETAVWTCKKCGNIWETRISSRVYGTGCPSCAKMQLKNQYDSIWDNYYQLAVDYYLENNNLLIPSTYRTKNGINLGDWISKQRQKYKKGLLSKDKINRLSQIKMVWDSTKYKWFIWYDLAKEYYDEYGNLEISQKEKYKNKNLGIWLYEQIKAYNKGILSKEKIDLLESLNIIWNHIDMFWNNGFQQAKKIFDEYGDLDIPHDYVTEDGFKLGVWLCNQRQNYRKNKLSDDRINDLKNIGMIWSNEKYDLSWEVGYEHSLEFFRNNKHLKVPQFFVSDDGYKLGLWIGTQRYKAKKGLLKTDYIERLDAIGFIWNDAMSINQTSFPETTIKYYLQKVFDNVEKNKEFGFELDIYIPELNFAIEYDGERYHSRIDRNNRDNRKNKLCKKNGITLLRIREPNCMPVSDESINYIMKSTSHTELEKSIIFLLNYLKKLRNFNIPNVDIQRDYSEIYTLMEFNNEEGWNNGYQKAKEYFEEEGNLNVPATFVYKDYRLGQWIHCQRQAFKGESNKYLTDIQIQKLNDIGMIWDHFAWLWDKGYEKASEYYQKNGNLEVPYRYKTEDGFKLGNWISTQRSRRKGTKGRLELTEEQILKLDKINMIWDT